MNFANALKNEIDNSKTLTQNGGITYVTSGKKLLDFNFKLAALRNTDEQRIADDFSLVYYENPLIAIKYLFWLRDCREGAGERKIFRACMHWLAENKLEIAKAVTYLIPEYGRFDDWWWLLDTGLRSHIINHVREQLSIDKLVIHPSLLAKWMPSLNTSSARTRAYGKIICNGLSLTPRQYRKTLSDLRRKLNVVECDISANKWKDVDYATVPSQANLKYANAFMAHDKDRRTDFLNSLKKGETKINAKVLQPHEIISKYKIYKYDETLEQLWKSLPKCNINNMLVVRDGSGSMMSKHNSPVAPIDVATALAIYTAENNNGIWKDKFITFSAYPKFVDLGNCQSLKEKIIVANKEADFYNTNIEATMMLILNAAITNHCAQKDMPSSILIISDMEFDEGTYDNNDTVFEAIEKNYRRYRYLLPKMIFWNVAGHMANNIPIKQNENGVILMSGFSTQLLKMAMNNNVDSYMALLDTISAERYDKVENAVKGLIL